MYLDKYTINGTTYVKLDDLNEMLDDERKNIEQEMKHNHEEGKCNSAATGAHVQVTNFSYKVNMSRNGEKYVLFTRDKHGAFEYFMDIVPWDDIPAFVRKHMAKTDCAVLGTHDIEEAKLFDTLNEAFKCKIEHGKIMDKWHCVKKGIFDTEHGADEIVKGFYSGDNQDKPTAYTDAEKAEALEQAEKVIEDTRQKLDRAETLVGKLKGKEKPDERRRANCPGRYTVWYRNDEDTTQHCMGFVRFEQGIPVFTNRPCKAMWFTWRSVAEKVAEKCGEGFEVVDMIDQMTAEERLLRAIFKEDGMDDEDVDVCEWNGDGTPVEDEDWESEKNEHRQ